MRVGGGGGEGQQEQMVTDYHRQAMQAKTVKAPKAPLWDIFIPSLSGNYISHSHVNSSLFQLCLLIYTANLIAINHIIICRTSYCFLTEGLLLHSCSPK